MRPPLLHDETFSQRVRAALRSEIGDDAVDALLSASRTSSKEWGGEEHWSPGVLQLSARHMAQTIASAQRLVATLATQYVKRKQLEMEALRAADVAQRREATHRRLVAEYFEAQMRAELTHAGANVRAATHQLLIAPMRAREAGLGWTNVAPSRISAAETLLIATYEAAVAEDGRRRAAALGDEHRRLGRRPGDPVAPRRRRYLFTVAAAASAAAAAAASRWRRPRQGQSARMTTMASCR